MTFVENISICTLPTSANNQLLDFHGTQYRGSLQNVVENATIVCKPVW